MGSHFGWEALSIHDHMEVCSIRKSLINSEFRFSQHHTLKRRMRLIVHRSLSSAPEVLRAMHYVPKHHQTGETVWFSPRPITLTSADWHINKQVMPTNGGVCFGL